VSNPREPGTDVLIRDSQGLVHRVACDRSVRRWDHKCSEFQIIDASRAQICDIVATLGDHAIAGEVVA
jgi:hypothetical protein